MTEWRPVPGYEGAYEVSDDGQVRSLDRVTSHGRAWKGRDLKQSINPGGYPVVGFSVGNKHRVRPVHIIVAAAFHGPRPEGLVIRHLDGDRLNNRASNLAYGTPTENADDMKRHGTHWQVQKTHCPKGHPYEGGNLIVTARGSRNCRECRNEQERLSYQLKGKAGTRLLAGLRNRMGTGEPS